jgi:hypothetical protein
LPWGFIAMTKFAIVVVNLWFLQLWIVIFGTMIKTINCRVSEGESEKGRVWVSEWVMAFVCMWDERVSVREREWVRMQRERERMQLRERGNLCVLEREVCVCERGVCVW